MAGEKIEGLIINSPEREKAPQTKILILEDTYGEVAKEGFNYPQFDVTVVGSIEELEAVKGDLNPDIVILDIEVPTKKGEKPTANEESKSIIQKKFPRAVTFFYTSGMHYKSGMSGEGGIGETVAEATGSIWAFSGQSRWGLGTSETMSPGDQKKQKKLDDEVMGKYGTEDFLPNKKNPNNWRKVLEAAPILISGMQLKMHSFKNWPDDIKKRILELMEIHNPQFADALERAQWLENKKSE